ncbi:PTS IIA-like nitrogen-regulatory protein PtsN [Dissulfuribacter thermophilus]|uniref:PTS IIA-like nitrogen-regulatory protein PtsN n=1 Tax=Dissulfuribacter thermophilus TaxID=1156395 RepID=A0A1B9F3Q1_9BACT|nr:PTS sugar transporter subunit IIA [Dissulfuribacter thermophilus]OCC14552.1 PTS IIA-like nitrogen-regulatory protein PtsN [Dissulfuribacter thermophilus]
MFITQFLCEKCIIADLSAASKDEVLQKLAQKASDLVQGVAPEAIFETLKEREQLGSTGIGNGIAIPHGKIHGLERLLVIFARSKEGVPFEALDHQPVHAIFLLLAPETASTAYLKILARISRLLKTPNVYEHLMNADNALRLLDVIKDVDCTLPLSI